MPNTPEVKIISSLGAAPYSLVESGGDVSVLMGFLTGRAGKWFRLDHGFLPRPCRSGVNFTHTPFMK